MNTSFSTTMTPVQRFWGLLKPDRREITQLYVYAIFNGLVGLSLPLGIQAIINLIQGGQMSTSWAVLVAFVIAVSPLRIPADHAAAHHGEPAAGGLHTGFI